MGTSLPSDAVPVQTSHIDKLLHFTIYSVFAFLLTQRISEDTTLWRAALGAVIVAAAFAAADEWHQRFIPGRFPEVADWVADVAGALTGALLCVAFAGRRRRSAQATAE